ncbi:hypothetical protein PMPD1_4449 (plasmid) [Paramixta manurensis]|uniref:Uncharacterized protein n=1 Tax=Paramixta manurensis TaxID=2740817 RepID=A0A6M8ULM6_9GAMM|nr:hypothetical protein PMPD1_4449 [Erwiniaceae bacterium PD-1]
MHYEFALDSLNEFRKRSGNGDFEFIKNWATEPEMLAFAASNGDSKAADICRTISGMTGYSKPTAKQKAALAVSMLSGRTAKDILIAVYGEKMAALFAEQEAAELAGDPVRAEAAKSGIKISGRRIAFGLIAEWIAKPSHEEEGVTYRASEKAVAMLEDENADHNGPGGLVTAEIAGELIVVTMRELKKLGQKDHFVKQFETETTDLKTYIDKHYASQREFAQAMGVADSKVSLWCKEGWIVYGNHLWSSKRSLPATDSERAINIPATGRKIQAAGGAGKDD